MDPDLKVALEQPDVREVVKLAALHADSIIRRYFWRGYRPTASISSHEVLAGDRSAEDFVMDALAKLIEGAREYNPSKTLLENLNSATDSLIWSHKVASDKKPLEDYAVETNEEGQAIDPISTAKDETPNVADAVITNEAIEDQKRAFENLRASFDGEDDVQAYLDAMKEGYFKVADIATVTDMPAERVSEIRRMVRKYAKKFFGFQNFADLKRKIERDE